MTHGLHDAGHVDAFGAPGLAGKTKIKVPPGSQTGKIFRLKGQGVTHLKRSGRGDQIILLTVLTPEQLNDKQRQMLKDLGASLTEQNMPSPEKRKNWLDGAREAFGD